MRQSVRQSVSPGTKKKKHVAFDADACNRCGISYLRRWPETYQKCMCLPNVCLDLLRRESRCEIDLHSYEHSFCCSGGGRDLVVVTEASSYCSMLRVASAGIAKRKHMIFHVLYTQLPSAMSVCDSASLYRFKNTTRL